MFDSIKYFAGEAFVVIVGTIGTLVLLPFYAYYGVFPSGPKSITPGDSSQIFTIKKN